MRFHWDLTLNCLLRSPKSSARLHTVDFKRGDAALIEIVFYAGSDPVLLEPGHEIRFAIKRKGQHDGEPLVYTATFAENTDARTYTASPSFNTAALTALFASPNAPDRLDLMGEFSLRNGDQSQGWQSSQTLNVCVFNDVIRGNEGEPGSVIDAQQSWHWLLASVGAGANVTLTPDPVARVLTIGAAPGASGNGWSPLFAIVPDGDRRVLRLMSWTGGTGDAPQGAGQYLGPAGLVSTPAEALDLRGAQGSAGINGIDGADATPITGISFDGSSLTFQTSTGQSFGPFYVRGADGADGPQGQQGAEGQPGVQGPAGADATPITAISFDGYNLSIQTSTGQNFGPFYVRGTDGGPGAPGANGADATPITSINFDGSNLTFQTSTGQSFGPFYVRGADGADGPQGQQGANGEPGAPGADGEPGAPGADGADATPITDISFDGYNLSIQTSTGQDFGPFYVRGSNGADGADATPITDISFDGSNLTFQTSTGQSFGPFYVRGADGSTGSDGANGNNGWSPLFTAISDGERRVLQLQSWTGGSGSTPGYEGYYLGASGLTPNLYDATDIRGERGSDGAPGADGGNGGSTGADGANGWSPLFIAISDGERRVLQLQNWTGGSGSTPGSEGYYLGASGFTPYLYEAVDLRGASGSDGSNGADATPITNIDFDGSNLTFYTSSGQSFGPFYVRGSDGPPGADGGSGGSNGADGANGWSPQLAIVLDGDRHVLQLQSWVGGGGSTPGNEGSYLGPYGYTTSISEAVDIRGSLQPLAPIDNVNGTASLSGSDTVDVAQLEAQIADLQTKLQLVLDRLRSHNLISAS